MTTQIAAGLSDIFPAIAYAEDGINAAVAGLLLDDEHTWLLVSVSSNTNTSAPWRVSIGTYSTFPAPGSPFDQNTTLVYSASILSGSWNSFDMDIVTNGEFWQFLWRGDDGVWKIGGTIFRPTSVLGATSEYRWPSLASYSSAYVGTALVDYYRSTRLFFMGAKMPLSRVDNPGSKILKYKPPLFNTSSADRKYEAYFNNIYISSPVYSVLGQPEDAMNRMITVDSEQYWVIRPSEGNKYSIIAK